MTKSSFQPRFKITDELTDGLTRIERARGFLEAAELSEGWIRTMGERALLLEAHHTTHIEGTRLTLEQSERLLSGGKVKDADPDDVRELLNYKEAFEFVSEYLGSGDPITEGLIREIHKKLVSGVRGGNAHPGEYRQCQNYVINAATGEMVYTPPPAYEVPMMMSGLVDWLGEEKKTHPVLVSGIAQYQLVHIHPFLDGNGRTSRLLSTLCLYRAGYDFKRLFTLSQFYDRNRPMFYLALQSVRDHKMDMTHWLEYFVKGMVIQLGEVKKKGEIIIRRDVMVRELNLNARQAKALGFVLEYGKITIKDYEAMCPKVNRKTLQRDLRELLGAGVMVSEGSARSIAYRMAKK